MRALAAKYLGPRSPGNAASASAAPAGAAMPNPNPSPPLASNSPGLQGNASNAPVGSASGQAMSADGPAVPPTVPNGSAYSPSRSVWKDRDGDLFDQHGRAMN
jgi:hypothetical protein